jgi:outer membrane receptor protein involved in Fe transport
LVRSATPACILGFASALLAQAQNTPAAPTDGTVQLSAFEVTTTRDIGYQATNAAEATRMNMPIADIPLNVTVFNQQFMEDILAVDTTDVLRYDASVVKKVENDSFAVRGFTSVGSNFLNGFPQPTGFGSQSVANVERVEVLKGPAAILYGQGGFGATINRITKRPLMKAHTSIRATYGSGDSVRFAFDNSGPVPFAPTKLLYRLNFEATHGEVYRGTPYQRTNIAPSLTWNITDRTQLTAEYIYDRDARSGGWAFPMHAGDPYGMTTGDGVYRTYGSPDKTFNTPGDIRLNTRQVVGLDLRHIFTPNWQFRSQVQLGDRNQHQVETQLDTEAITLLRDAVLMARSWRDLPRGTVNYRTRNELVAKIKTGPLQHRLLAGHAWDQQYDEPKTERSSKNFGGFAPGTANLDGPGRNSATGNRYNEYFNITLAQFMANPKLAGYNPNLLLPINVFDIPNSPAMPPMEARPPLYVDAWTKTVLQNMEFYANDVVAVLEDRVFVQGGIRHTDTRRRTLNRLSSSFPNTVVNSSAPWVYSSAKSTTHSVGAVWHLTREKTFTLYANMNSAFVPEFRSQPDGEGLDPQEANQQEIGLRFNLWGGAIQGLVTFYDLKQDNVTIADPSRDGYFLQVSDQRSKGIEVGLNARPKAQWQVFGSYAYVDAVSESTRSKITMQPEHSVSVFNRYDFENRLKGLYASVGVRYGSSTVSDGPATRTFEPSWRIPSSVVSDVIVGYGFRTQWRGMRHVVALNVKNVFDNTRSFYVASPDRWTVENGREWLLSISTKF